MFEYNFKLIKVVDGDTVDIDIDLGFGVWLKNQRIRLIGIDTPESRTRDEEEKKFGLLANGSPTTNASLTVDKSQISANDNYDYVLNFEEFFSGDANTPS